MSQFGKNRTKAIAAYRQFVMEGKGLPDPKGQVRHQMFLGSDAFIAEHQQATEKPEKLREVSKAHKRSVALTLSDYQDIYKGMKQWPRLIYPGHTQWRKSVGILKFTI